MKLIEKTNIKSIEVSFYEGIDMDFAINHPKDGSNGLIIFFIDSWVNEVKTYERQNKLKSILDNDNSECFKLEDIDNNYLSIYQTNGVGIEQTYNIIKDKMLNGHFPNMPYIPINGIDKGAWKIQKGYSIS